MRARDVGVDPDDDVAGEHLKALPEPLAFTAVGAGLGGDLVVDENGHAFVLGDLARSIERTRIDHGELADERKAPDEAGADRADDLSGCRFPIARGKAAPDTAALSLFRRDSAAH